MTISRPTRTLLTALAALALLAGAAGCGSSGKPATSAKTSAGTTAAPDFRGPQATPPLAASPLVLDNSLGKRVNLADDRGKVVLLTFIYTHCPDICPLIAGHLHTVLSELGPKASSVKLIAVSTDPRGDTKQAVKSFLAAHQLTGQMDYLVGSRAQLTKVWRAWGIQVEGSGKSSLDQVAHSALVYGISAKGKVTTLYPSNFKPADVVHDVPLLAEG